MKHTVTKENLTIVETTKELSKVEFAKETYVWVKEERTLYWPKDGVYAKDFLKANTEIVNEEQEIIWYETETITKVLNWKKVERKVVKYDESGKPVEKKIKEEVPVEKEIKWDELDIQVDIK